jgi:hypothetical protein
MFGEGLEIMTSTGCYQQQSSKVTKIRHKAFIIMAKCTTKIRVQLMQRVQQEDKDNLECMNCSSGQRTSEYCSTE